MNGVQILTIAIPLSTNFVAVFIAVLLNNSRLNDLREFLGAKIEGGCANVTKDIDAGRANVTKEIDLLREQTCAGFDRIEAKLEKIDANVARILNHEHRLTQLEGGKN